MGVSADSTPKKGVGILGGKLKYSFRGAWYVRDIGMDDMNL